MKHWNYRAVIYNGQALCLPCVPSDANSEDIAPIFANEAQDSYPVCALCAELHDYMPLNIQPGQIQNEDAYDAVNW